VPLTVVIHAVRREATVPRFAVKQGRPKTPIRHMQAAIWSRCGVSAILAASTNVMSYLFTYLSLQPAHTPTARVVVTCLSDALFSHNKRYC